MNSFKQEKLIVSFSQAGKVQSAFDSPLALSNIDRRHPQTTKTFPSIERQREQTRGCSGEYIVKEEITSEIMRLRFGFTPSAHLLALWGAMSYGAAGNPTGTTANAKQTIVATGDGTLTFAFEGLTGTTGTVGTATTAAQLKTALENLDSIKPGNVDVTGISLAAPGLVVEFKNDLAKAPMPLFTHTGLLTATSLVVGANKLHPITRSTLEAMILTSLVIGFEGDSTDADLYKNVAVNGLTITVPKIGKATAEIDLVGSAKTIAAIGFIKPGCIAVDPIYARDCRVRINEQFYTKKLFEMRWSYSNNIIIDAEGTHDWDSKDISNLERGNRTATFSFTHYGSKGDPLHTLAKDEPTVPLEMHFGKPGDRFSWFAVAAKLRIDDAGTTFVGSKSKSAIPISGDAFEDEDTGEVDYIEANIAQTSAFLST